MNIATHASRIEHSASAKDAVGAAVQALSNLYDAAETQAEKHQLAEVYNYFLVKNQRPKTNWAWLAAAIDPKHAKAAYQLAYCDGKKIYATDGHRLHVCNNEINSHSLEVGWYDKLMNPVNSDRPPPDYQKIMTSFVSTKTVRLADCNIRQYGKLKTVELMPGIEINDKFLATKLNTVDVHYNADPNGCVMISCEYGQMFIMPMTKRKS